MTFLTLGYSGLFSLVQIFCRRRRIFDMRRTRFLAPPLILVFCLFVAVPHLALGQDEAPVRHGRKYKAPPETSHIEVLVTKKANGKPISNAAVVFNPSKDGKDIGSLEVKTDPEGKAIIDVIPTGSLVRVQIIANGYATFAEDYLVTEPTRQISIAMLRPQEQISAYEENHGKASARKPGVQEPAKPTTPATSAKPSSSSAPSKPAAPPAATPQQQ
jgi:hypothetical protein